MFASIKTNGLVLALFALVCTSVVAITQAVTKDQIARQEQQQLLKIINQLLPASGHNNDIFQSCKLITNEQFLGSSEPQRVFIAKQDDEIVGYAVEGIAPAGYNGKIKLVVGINTDNAITGVRVLSHNETPGLGDKVDRRKSNWVDSFVGRKLTEENDATWAVKKDGGDFDSFTGATITPRAVLASVKNILIFSNEGQLAQLKNAPSCWSKS